MVYFPSPPAAKGARVQSHLRIRWHGLHTWYILSLWCVMLRVMMKMCAVCRYTLYSRPFFRRICPGWFASCGLLRGGGLAACSLEIMFSLHAPFPFFFFVLPDRAVQQYGRHTYGNLCLHQTPSDFINAHNGSTLASSSFKGVARRPARSFVTRTSAFACVQQ